MELQTFGEYQLIKRIGVGGMAEIYMAKARGIQGFEKILAIKVIHPRYAKDKDFTNMLIEEAKIAVQLNHVNITQIFDLGIIDKRYYISMEYVDGHDLYRIMATCADRNIKVPFDIAAFIAQEVCSGLDYAHRKKDLFGKPLKLIHRDISPQNILVSYNGEVKIVDFGIAKVSTKFREETQVGVIKGKFYYMSPEQASAEEIDQRSDLFSLGICLYEMLAGHMLYYDLHGQTNTMAILDRIREARIPSILKSRADTPPDLEKIVLKALQKDRNKRFLSAQEFQTKLTQFLFSFNPNFNRATVGTFLKRIYQEEVSVVKDMAIPEEDNVNIMSRQDFRPHEASVIFSDTGTASEDKKRQDIRTAQKTKDLSEIINHRRGQPKPLVKKLFPKKAGQIGLQGKGRSTEPDKNKVVRKAKPLPTVPPQQAGMGLSSYSEKALREQPTQIFGAAEIGPALSRLDKLMDDIPDESSEPMMATSIDLELKDLEELPPEMGDMDLHDKATLADDPWQSLGPSQPVLSRRGPLRSPLAGESPDNRATQIMDAVDIQSWEEKPSSLQNGIKSLSAQSSPTQPISPLPSPPQDKEGADYLSRHKESEPDPLMVISSPVAQQPMIVSDIVKVPPASQLYIKLLVIGIITLCAIGGVIIYLLLKTSVNMGIVMIGSDPPGAKIKIDGKPIEGRTPIYRRVESGKYLISLEMEGYYPVKVNVTVSSKADANVYEKLVMLPGQIFIDSIPRHAKIYIGNAYNGETPLKIENLPRSESFTLRLSLDGYEDYSEMINFGSKTTLEILRNLELKEEKPVEPKPKKK